MSHHTPMQESTMRLDQSQRDRYRHDCSGTSRTGSPRNLMFQVYNRDDNRPSGDQWRRPHRSPWLLEHDTPVLAPVPDQALTTLAPAA